jgi:tetratricopeptide (TPR) repeat protein
MGLQALQAGRFDNAIATWSGLEQRDARVVAALAEAYFRRALTRPVGQEQVADLQRAVALAPAELRYQYHLGLALHRAGDRAAAMQRYRTVLQHDAAWPGAGMTLALAALEQDPRADLAALPGSTPAIRRALAPVQTLLQGAIPAAGGDEPLERLWHSLGLVRAGDAAARQALDDSRPLPSRQATAVRRYYQGVAAAQAGDVDAAAQRWQDLYDQGTHTPWLLQNLAAVLLHRLREPGEGADLEPTMALAQRVAAEGAGGAALGEALIGALDRAAHAAAESGDWARAAALWEKARQVVSAGTGLGSPRPLLHNLALAYEAQERWLEAAEAWRAMLRTRPRRRSTAQPMESPAAEGGLSAAQWAWVRGRVIECYKRADAPGEAVAIFRQAIKAEPDDLDLRLQLADALLANEQEQAAFNELQRLLQLDPQYVEAQLRLAELHMARGEWYAAEQMLRQALKQHPENEEVRRRLVRLLLEYGQEVMSWGQRSRAIKLFEEGQRLAPDEYQFPLNLARIAVEQRKPERARGLLEQALALGADQPRAYVEVIECWAVANKIDEARAVVARAEAALPPTPELYLDVGLVLLKRIAAPSLLSPFSPPAPTKESPAADSPWVRLAEEVLDRAVALRPDDVGLHRQIAVDLLEVRPDLGLRYAQEAARLAPDDPHNLMLLGLVQGLNKHTREAKDTLRRAAGLARRQGDVALAQQIESMRQDIDNPLLHLALRMGPLLGDDDLDDDLDLF